MLAPEEWGRFATTHREKIGDVSRYLPWLLDALPPDRIATITAGLKPDILVAYETEWRAAYDRLTLWGPTAEE